MFFLNCQLPELMPCFSQRLAACFRQRRLPPGGQKAKRARFGFAGVFGLADEVFEFGRCRNRDPCLRGSEVRQLKGHSHDPLRRPLDIKGAIHGRAAPIRNPE